MSIIVQLPPRGSVISVPTRLIFESAVNKAPTDYKYIFLTDSPHYADNLLGDTFFTVYISPKPDSNAYTIDEFRELIYQFDKASYIREFFFFPICTKARNTELYNALKDRGCKYSRSAWQSFKRGPDYYQDHIDELIQDAESVIDKKEGRRSPGSAQKEQPVQVNYRAEADYFNPFETPEKIQRYALNDIGAGNFFADAYRNVSRYVPEAKAWYVYDGRVWHLDLGGVVVSQQAKDLTDYMLDCRKYIDDDKQRETWVKYVAGRMKRAARETMLADAASVYPVSIKEFDKNPYLFNCQNCTIDLRGFTPHKHRQDDFLSKISNVNFDSSTECSRWSQFIYEIMRGDMETAKFLQKALGYALTGDTSEECFFILFGSTTRNGKGTTMETTLHIMGDYGRTAQPETIAQKQITHSGGPSEDIARLKGARFVNMSEPDKGLRLNSALVKQMTGGDTMTARFLNQNSFEYRPEYKLFINTNHLPNVGDDSIFASGRVKLIPFERHFSENEQDKGLKDLFKQPKNMSGIFNWFIEGLKLMQIEGLERPQAVRDATAQYRGESNIVGLFVRECLVGFDGSKTSIKDVYAEYDKWCNEYGYGALSNKNLIMELRKKGLIIKVSTGNRVYLFDYGLACHEAPPEEWQ